MRNLKKLTAVLLTVIFIQSCEKDEIDPLEAIANELSAQISAKWVVETPATEFISFEFNESGNYIVVMEAPSASDPPVVRFGAYKVTSETGITLIDLGTLTINSVTDNSFDFSVKLSGSTDEVSLSSTKQEEMESSTRTELLCRTWEMVSINGFSVAGTEEELTVLFSKAGTYFVAFTDPDDESDGGLASWKWKDANELYMQYSWDVPPVWDDDSQVEITELNSNSMTIVEYDETFVLKPVVNKKQEEKQTPRQLQKSMSKKEYLNEINSAVLAHIKS